MAGKEGSAVLRGILKKEETGTYLCANRKNQWRKNQDTEQSEENILRSSHREEEDMRYKAQREELHLSRRGTFYLDTRGQSEADEFANEKGRREISKVTTSHSISLMR